jgi:Flp pilus assembly protein TadD
MGAIYYRRHRLELAEVAFATACRLDTAYPEPLEGEALLRLRNGECQRARAALAEARRLRGALPEEQLTRKRLASVQSLASWPWPDAERLLAAEERRQALDQAAEPDQQPAADLK